MKIVNKFLGSLSQYWTDVSNSARGTVSDHAYPAILQINKNSDKVSEMKWIEARINAGHITSSPDSQTVKRALKMWKKSCKRARIINRPKQIQKRSINSHLHEKR